jgi:UDP-N-acetylmuramoyl-tripeptide--D-alanyl-D-alanine ligase
MSMLSLDTAAAAVGGQVRGATVAFDSVSTDTRTLAPGALFVALAGPSFDGHDYCAQALERGAVAALVSRPVDAQLAQIQVKDTRAALGRLAAAWRDRYRVPVVAITGSNGKTTVKEMVCAILRTAGDVLASRGNLNNDIGLPLTLLRLRDEDCFAVCEMGANHSGEIAYLCTIARPDVGLISNAAPAHLAGFGSLDGVARAKGEIVQGVSGAGAVVLNADDRYLPLWLELAAGRRCVTFGFAAGADVRASSIAVQTMDEANCLLTTFDLHHGGRVFPVKLALPGRHNVANALAAAAVAFELGLESESVREGLAAMRAVPGRLQLRSGYAGARVVDDSYNANPQSFETAFEVLQALTGETWVVLGDMGELGDDTESFHEQLGARARSYGVARLFAVGEFSRAAVRRFGPGGSHYADHQSLVEALLPQLHEGVDLLVKGSRAQHLERVVNALCAEKGA